METKQAVSKRLSNYDYVMGLKSLSTMEREILFQRYGRQSHHTFGIGHNATSASIRSALAMLENYTQEKGIKLHTIVTNCNGLLLLGTTDTNLIKRAQCVVRRDKANRDYQLKCLKQERERNARNKLLDRSLKRAKGVVVCENVAEAREIIGVLRKRFPGA